MSKFQYTHFGDEVPREVEKEYNRMGRREHYLEEQDAAHDVIFILIGDVLSGDTLCHAGCLPIVYHYLGIKITDRRCTAVLTA